MSALASLLASPQNNLRLFRDGRALPPPSPPHASAGWAAAAAAGILPAAQLVAAVQRALGLEGALARLLAAQQQCTYDVEGVYYLYCQLTGQAPDLHDGPVDGVGLQVEAAGSAGGWGDEAGAEEEARRHAEAVGALLTLPHEQAHAVLRAYSVSTTAKDCALMLAFQQGEGAAPAERPQRPVGGSGSRDSEGVVHVPGQDGWLRYRLAIVDLDLKPLAKIPAHWRLDRQILTAAAAARQHPQPAIT